MFWVIPHQTRVMARVMNRVRTMSKMTIWAYMAYMRDVARIIPAHQALSFPQSFIPRMAVTRAPSKAARAEGSLAANSLNPHILKEAATSQ